MIRFDHLVEEWATLYKPMQHVPGKNSPNRRFYPFDSINRITSIATELPTVGTPCVGYESHLEGDIEEGRIRPSYKVFFFVNSGTDQRDAFSDADVKAQCLDHAIKFLAWARQQKEERPGSGLKYLDLENTNYLTWGPLLNNWFAVSLSFSNLEAIQLCVNPNDYITPPNSDEV